MVFQDKFGVLEDVVYLKCICGECDWCIDKWMMKCNVGLMCCDCVGYWFLYCMGSFYCQYCRDGSDWLLGYFDFWICDMMQD